MSQQQRSSTNPAQPAIYVIEIQGHLGVQWSDWFDGMQISLQEDGTTCLSGEIVDQAALHGLLRTIRDLGLPLISVVRTEPHLHSSTQGDQP